MVTIIKSLFENCFKSLFTNVPIDKTLEVIGNKLINDQSLEERSILSPEQITKLVEVCLKTTYFVYNSEYYEQLEGAAMGSPVSPIVANIFMEHFEEIALDSRFRLWRRYVDDVFCIIKRSNVETELVYLNSLFPSITFTVEKEQDGTLPFMDVLVSRLVDGSMMTSVYRKPTHTDRYLSYNSNHPPHVKRGVIKSLLNRARDISSQSTLGSEIEHVRIALEANGYPRSLINKEETILKQRLDDSDHGEEEKPPATAVIPYVSVLSERVRKILKDYGIRTAFRTGFTLAKLLTRVKDPTKKEEIMGAVYKIKCVCGDFYIGESGRALGERIKEHKAACKYAYFDKSPVAEHAWKDGDHQINWDDVDIIDRAQGMTERRVKEAIYIGLAPPGLTLNRDIGLELSPIIMRAARGLQS